MTTTQVLLIDDDEDDCELFVDALKMVDPSVDCQKALTGESAIGMCQQSFYRPDYIFLDINMGVYGGRKCLIEIAKIKALHGVPVIMYTTSKRQVDKEWCYELGAVHYITKPYSLTELCEELKFVLQQNWTGKSSPQA